MKRKILTILLACVLAAGTVSSPAGMETALAEETEEKETEEKETEEKETEDGFRYSACEDGTDGITITGYSGEQTDIKIPGSIDGVNVTGIGYLAFNGCSSLRSVVIPESVESIGVRSFEGCSMLTSISLPSKVTSIKAAAFQGCSMLSYISIPKGVTNIDVTAFSNCNMLRTVYYAGSREQWKQIKIGEGNGLLQKATIYLDSSGFGDFGSGMLYEPIEPPAWRYEYFDRESIVITGYAKTDTELVIPDSIDGKKVIGIGDGVFAGRMSMTSVIIPSGVTSIGDSVFSGCSGLTSISLPSGVTSIGDRVFFGCSGLTSISLPSGITSIGSRAFENCSSLTSISLPSGITSIGSWAFENCSGLTNISLPSGITDISAEAFSGCSSLTNISLPSGITGISAATFSGCSSLTSISLPSGITWIGGSAFENCSGLTSISLPAGIEVIYDGAFEGSGLTDVYYAGSQEQWNKIKIYTEINEEEELEGNRRLQSAKIHFGISGSGGSSSGSGDSGSGGSASNSNTRVKSSQSVTANDIIKTYGETEFSLGAKSSGGTVLSYEVSNPKVAKVDANGKVTIMSCGITDITITAAETTAYTKAQKTIMLTVKPKKMALSSVKSQKKKTATVKWKKDKSVSGYVIECATDRKFKKNKVRVTVKKNKKVSVIVKKLKPGKKYYVRICAYAKSGSVSIQGEWSREKAVKVKK